MPVADQLVRADIHVQTHLPCIEDHHENRKKDHFDREEGEDKETNAVKKLARTTALVLPLVISAPAPTGWASV